RGSYNDGSRYSLPAAEGETFYLGINVPGFPHGDNRNAGRLSLYVAGDDRPLGEIKQAQVPRNLNTWGREPYGVDKRFFLIPTAKLLVILPEAQDRLLLYRVDVDKILAQSNRDYLVTTTRAPATAHKGKTYAFPITVLSNKGGVKYKLESGP